MSLLDKLHAIFTFDGLLGSRPPARDRNAEILAAQFDYERMRQAMSEETPEQKAAFYAEVGRLLREQKDRPK